MTPKGYEALQEELKRLKSQERPSIVREIEEARAHGDLSENAEYHAAKEKQGHIEGRIALVEDKLARAQVIEITEVADGRVRFGATVTLEDIESGDQETYTIVGEDEADAKLGKISVTSPIARAMIGKEQDSTVSVQVPKGKREFEILGVEYKV
ncbi:transcription elongation factor GreA [Myxococcota bacterium]|nr:transcription elongation factor GreA [Myxococcota bacterium]